MSGPEDVEMLDRSPAPGADDLGQARCGRPGPGWPPTLVAVGPGAIVLVGLPGAGKSTLAGALAERLPDCRVLDKDEVRHALFAPPDYSTAERDVAFSAMLDAARYHLGRGRLVVFDGLTFSRRSEVVAVETVAQESGAFAAVVVCDVPLAVAIERCESDAAARGHRAANRDGDLVRRVAASMEEPAGAYLTLDTTGDLDRLVGQAIAYIHEIAG
ncbi:MAG: ATP-binding protein [Actinobacteria bacterium]|nr:ATP-binding protein [Actinomycetota bacterium]